MIRAQVCNPPNNTYGNTDTLTDYRINSADVGDLNGVPGDMEFQAAVTHAAAIWGEQAKAGFFRYTGDTGETDIPTTTFGCWWYGVDYSLIVVDTQNNATAGAVFPRCGGSQFLMRVYSRNQAGDPRSWSVGDPSPGRLDLVSLIAHEFGHTLDLGHPTGGESAVMRPDIGNNCTAQRDLWQLDLECSEQRSGGRSLSGIRRWISGGTVSAPATFTSAYPYSLGQGTPGYTYDDPPYMTYTAATLDSDLAQGRTVTTWHSQTPIHGVGTSPGAHGEVREASWPEQWPWQDRRFFSHFQDYPTSYAWSSSHVVRYARSSDFFASQATGALRYCTSMASWLTCSATTPVRSNQMIAVAFDADWSGRTVTAWVDATPGAACDNPARSNPQREVLVSIGYVNDWTLPEPDSLNVRSVVAPGLACRAFAASGYDCLLAYVAQADTRYEVRLKRFYASIGPTRWHVVHGPDSQMWSNLRTAHSIGLWYHNDRWWVAIKPMRLLFGPEVIEVYSSSDSTVWTSEGTFGSSVVGPSAIGYLDVSTNVMFSWWP